MTLHATISAPPAKKLDTGGGLWIIPSRMLGWDEMKVRTRWRRPPLQVVVGSSRNPGRPRAPIWRGRVLSNEALRVVQELKRVRANGGDDRVSAVLKAKVARLLKADMVAVLGELQRQDECELALKVFDIVRKEFWYKPDEGLFSELVITLARNNLIEKVERLYSLAKEEGLQSIVRFYSEVIGAQVSSGNTQKAMEVYDELKKAGFFPCDPAYGILRKGLESNGELQLAAAVEQEYKEALEADVVEHAVYS